MSQAIKLVGMDPSLRHWGWAAGTLDPESGVFTLKQVGVIAPFLAKTKTVRQNSMDLDCACQLYEGALKATAGAQAIFVEVPHGSQSSRAMASYGICCGVLGALRYEGRPFFEVTALEVKLAATGNKKSGKDEMIDWARTQHPEVAWSLNKSVTEHQADAVGAIYAGVRSNAFKQVLPLLLPNQGT